MSTYDKAIVVGSAKAFAQSEIMENGAVADIAHQMTEQPSFVHWEIVRVDWTAAYAIAKKCNTLATNKGWERITKRMCEAYGLGKPKSEAKVSAEKQASRESAKLESAKLVESAGITADSTTEEILQKAGKVTGAQQRALTDAAIVKGKADEKAASVARTARKAAMCKALKLCDIDKTLDSISKLLGLK